MKRMNISRSGRISLIDRTGRFRLLALAFFCLAGFAALAACGLKSPPMDLSEFRWQCNFAGTTGSGQGRDNDSDGGPTGCDPFYQEQICQEYSTRLGGFTGDLQQCLDLCDQVADQIASERVYYSTCSSVTREVSNTCSRYCRRNYQ